MLAVIPLSRPTAFDFVELANIAKHNLHLGTDAALETVEAIQRHRSKYSLRYPDVKRN